MFCINFQSNKPLKPTVPQPFNLHDRKRKVEEPQANDKYISMAEVEKSVFGKTPDRFRSRPHNKGTCNHITGVELSQTLHITYIKIILSLKLMLFFL